jgi:hypothetical protein
VQEYLLQTEIFNTTSQFFGDQGTDPDVEAPVTPPMPRYLQLYLWCQEYHCLLTSGGILEQPFLLWHYIQTAGAAYEEVMARRRQEENEQWQKQSNRPSPMW